MKRVRFLLIVVVVVLVAIGVYAGVWFTQRNNASQAARPTIGVVRTANGEVMDLVKPCIEAINSSRKKIAQAIDVPYERLLTEKHTPDGDYVKPASVKDSELNAYRSWMCEGERDAYISVSNYIQTLKTAQPSATAAKVERCIETVLTARKTIAQTTGVAIEKLTTVNLHTPDGDYVKPSYMSDADFRQFREWICEGESGAYTTLANHIPVLKAVQTTTAAAAPATTAEKPPTTTPSVTTVAAGPNIKVVVPNPPPGGTVNVTVQNGMVATKVRKKTTSNTTEEGINHSWARRAK